MSDRIDIHSETWRALKRRTEARLEDLSRKMEDRAMDAEETTYMRGRIFELRELLRIEQPSKLSAVQSTGAVD